MHEPYTILTIARKALDTRSLLLHARRSMNMRLRTKLACLILALLAAITIHAAQKSDSAKVMLEAAKKKEVVDGDLNAAIQQYKAIIDKFKNDRAVVADALVHMAECYQKLGDTESRKI